MPKANNMNLLAELVGSRARAEILRILWSPGQTPLHLRAIQRRAGLSVAAIRRELERFRKLGLVKATADGNRTTFSVNPSHPIAAELAAIVAKTPESRRFFERL